MKTENKSMIKKPETVKEEEITIRKDSLFYKNNSNYPYTGVVEYFKKNTIVQIRTLSISKSTTYFFRSL